MKGMYRWICAVAIIAFASNMGMAQTVLYSTDFDGPETAVVPDGWTQVPGPLHEAAGEDPDFDWKAVKTSKFVILDPGSGDQVRDIMGYFRRNADGTANTDGAIGTSGGLQRDGGVQWERMSGSRAPWKNPPYFTGGEQPDGSIPETARVLVADSDEYGGVNLNMAIDSPAIDLQGSQFVRFRPHKNAMELALFFGHSQTHRGDAPTSMISNFPVGVCAPRFDNLRHSCS